MHQKGLEGIQGLVATIPPGPTLAAAPALDDIEIAGVARRLAQTLAEIHDVGYVHRNVEASRVVLDADGAPVLGGAELCEPGDDHGDDVVQWGALLAHLLQWGAAVDGAGFERPRTAPTTGRECRGRSADPLRVVRPGAGARRGSPSDGSGVGEPITHRLPEARLPGAPSTPPPPRPTAVRPRSEASLLERLGADTPSERSWRPRITGRTAMLIGAGIFGIAAIAVLPSVLVSGGAAHRDEGLREEAATGTAPSDCPPVAPPAADADGDGCDEPVTVESGVLVAGSLRFALGGDADQVVVGDWDCDGRRTPALLSGSTLAVYDAWPLPGAETHGRVLASVPGATALAVSNRSPCDVLVVTLPDAAPRIIDPRPKP